MKKITVENGTKVICNAGFISSRHESGFGPIFVLGRHPSDPDKLVVTCPICDEPTKCIERGSHFEGWCQCCSGGFETPDLLIMAELLDPRFLEPVADVSALERTHGPENDI